jgi:hypothetical protein
VYSLRSSILNIVFLFVAVRSIRAVRALTVPPIPELRVRLTARPAGGVIEIVVLRNRLGVIEPIEF